VDRTVSCEVELGLRGHTVLLLRGRPPNCLVATTALPNGHNRDCLPIVGCWLMHWAREFHDVRSL